MNNKKSSYLTQVYCNKTKRMILIPTQYALNPQVYIDLKEKWNSLGK